MDSIFVSTSFTPPFSSQFSSSHQNSNFCQIATQRSKIRNLASKRPKSPSKFFPISRGLFKFGSPEASRTAQCCKKEQKSIPKASGISNGKTEPVISVTKSIVCAIFCVAVSFSPVLFKCSAIAAPVASEMVLDKKERVRRRDSGTEFVLKAKDHEYLDCTRRLLETVSSLLKVIEEVRGGNGDVKSVKLALEAVRKRKDELQCEIMGGLYRDLRELRREKDGLVKHGEGIVDEVLKAQWESEKLEGEERAERLERVRRMEGEYGEVWERVGEIEDAILRRETMALSVGVRELCFIERECEELVKRFTRNIRRKSSER